MFSVEIINLSSSHFLTEHISNFSEPGVSDAEVKNTMTMPDAEHGRRKKCWGGTEINFSG